MKKIYKKELLITITLILIVISLIGGTYAMFQRVDEAEYANSYKTGNLQIEFDDTSEGLGGILNLNGTVPISNEEGEKTTPYKFKIKNTGNLDYQFDLKLVVDSTYVSSHGCEDMQLSADYIMIKINDKEPVVLSSLENNIIESDILLKTEEDLTYELRIWLKEGTPNSEIGKHYHAKLTTNGNAIYKEQTLAITLDNYTLSWEEVENAVSYDIYSDNELLVNTTNTSIDLYTYYQDAGTYEISIKAVMEDGSKSNESNILSYTIEKLSPTNPILVIVSEDYDTQLSTLVNGSGALDSAFQYIYNCSSLIDGSVLSVGELYPSVVSSVAENLCANYQLFSDSETIPLDLKASYVKRCSYVAGATICSNNASNYTISSISSVDSILIGSKTFQISSFEDIVLSKEGYIDSDIIRILIYKGVMDN